MSSHDYKRNKKHARVVERNQIQPEMLLHEAKIVCQTSCLILSCSWQRRLMPCYRTCTCQYRFVDRTIWARQTSPRWKRARWRVLEAVWSSISQRSYGETVAKAHYRRFLSWILCFSHDGNQVDAVSTRRNMRQSTKQPTETPSTPPHLPPDVPLESGDS
jgi:hypothetical protein